jgi:hypothetical protein
MATIQLQVVTPERVVLEEDADIVIARGAEGDLVSCTATNRWSRHSTPAS